MRCPPQAQPLSNVRCCSLHELRKSAEVRRALAASPSSDRQLNKRKGLTHTLWGGAQEFREAYWDESGVLCECPLTFCRSFSWMAIASTGGDFLIVELPASSVKKEETNNRRG